MVVTEGDIFWKLVHKQTINKKYNTLYILICLIRNNIYYSVELKNKYYCTRP